MKGLTQRQKEVLQGIHQLTRARGYPPTVREIMHDLGLSSTCTVQRHLEALQRKGYISRDASKARSIGIIASDDPTLVPRASVQVPLVGTVAAGPPIFAAEHIEEVFPLPKELVGDGQTFMLRIKGDSMIGAGLFDGDLAVVHQQDHADSGDIVVALMGEEATVKRFARQGRTAYLEPANPTMSPIPARGAQILGKVILSIRRFS